MKKLWLFSFLLVGCESAHYHVEFLHPADESRGRIPTVSSQFRNDTFVSAKVKVVPPLAEGDLGELRANGFQVFIDGRPFREWFDRDHRETIRQTPEATYLMMGIPQFCKLPEGLHELEFVAEFGDRKIQHMTKFNVECGQPFVRVDESGNLFAKSNDTSGLSVKLRSYSGSEVETVSVGDAVFVPSRALQDKANYYYTVTTGHGNGATIGMDGVESNEVSIRRFGQRETARPRRDSEVQDHQSVGLRSGDGEPPALGQEERCEIPKNIRIAFLFDDLDPDPGMHFEAQRLRAAQEFPWLMGPWDQAVSNLPEEGIPFSASIFNEAVLGFSFLMFGRKSPSGIAEENLVDYVGYDRNALPDWITPGVYTPGSRWEIIAQLEEYYGTPLGEQGTYPETNRARKVPTNLPLYVFDELYRGEEFLLGAAIQDEGYGFLSLRGPGGGALSSIAITQTIAHEIGHLLGLGHIENDGFNLMAFDGEYDQTSVSYAQKRMIHAAACGSNAEEIQFYGRFRSFGVNMEAENLSGCGDGQLAKNEDGNWEYCEDMFHTTPHELAVTEHNHAPEVSFQCAYHDTVAKKMDWPTPWLRCTQKCYCMPNNPSTHPPAPSRAPATRTPEGNSPSTPGPGDYGPSSPYPGWPGGGDPPDDDDDDDDDDSDKDPPGTGCRNSFIADNVDLSCAVDDCPPGKVCKHGFSANNVHIGCSCRPQIRTPEEPEDQFREMMRTPTRSSGTGSTTRF